MLRFAVAHILTCYLWVGAVAAYSALTRPAPTPTVETAFHDADGDGFDGSEGPPDDPWYLRGPITATLAPVSVPLLLVVAAFFSVASPVERFPAPTVLILVSLYLLPLFALYKLLDWRRRLRDIPPLH